MSSFEFLKKWIQENNGFIHPDISLDQTDPNNRVLICTKNIKQNELIFDIPKELCIGKDNSLNISNTMFESDIRQINSLHREFSIKENSKYYPYLCMMNDIGAYHQHPLYVLNKNPHLSKRWSKICNFSKIFDLRILKIKTIKLYFENNLGLKISDEQIMYYELLIMTRCWDNIGFVPFADLFQSCQTSEMLLAENEEKTHYQLHTDRDYKPGDTIWINYGIYDEALIYSTFGFIDDVQETRNIMRTIKIVPPSIFKKGSDDIAHKHEKITELKKNQHFLSTTGISNSLLEYFRVYNLSQRDYERILTVSGSDLNNSNYMKEFISLENELAVLRDLITILFSRIFPTKGMVDESDMILNNKDIDRSSVEYHLAKITLYQKQIFKNVFNLILKSWIGILRVPKEIIWQFGNHHLLDIQNEKEN